MGYFEEVARKLQEAKKKKQEEEEKKKKEQSAAASSDALQSFSDYRRSQQARRMTQQPTQSYTKYAGLDQPQAAMPISVRAQQIGTQTPKLTAEEGKELRRLELLKAGASKMDQYQYQKQIDALLGKAQQNTAAPDLSSVASVREFLAQKNGNLTDEEKQKVRQSDWFQFWQSWENANNDGKTGAFSPRLDAQAREAKDARLLGGDIDGIDARIDALEKEKDAVEGTNGNWFTRTADAARDAVENIVADPLRALFHDGIAGVMNNSNNAPQFYERLLRGITETRQNVQKQKDYSDEAARRISNIEGELGALRGARDYKKAEEATKDLSPEVVALLDEYNSCIDARNSAADGMVYQTFNEKAKAAFQKIEQKGYTADEINALAEYRTYVKDTQETQKMREEIESASGNPAKMAALSVGARALSPVGAVTGGIQAIKDALGNKATDLSINPDASGYYAQNIKNAIDETITGSFKDDKWKDAKAFAYQTAASGADSLVASMMWGGGALLGLGAGVDTMLDVKKSGGTDAQALLSGVAFGTFEGLFESLSIGKFKALQEVTPQGVKDVALNILKSTGVNASEETFTEIADQIADYCINGGLSKYETRIRDGIAAGLTVEEAKKQAADQSGKEIALSGLGGALMGNVFGGVGSAMGYQNGQSDARALGQELADADEVDALLTRTQEGKNGAVRAQVQQATDAVRQGEEVKNALREELSAKGIEGAALEEKTDLAYQAMTAPKTLTKTQRTQAAADEDIQSAVANVGEQYADAVKGGGAKTEYSKKDLTNIGRLAQATQRDEVQANRTQIQQATHDRLRQLGETAQTAETVAGTITDALEAGGTLTKAQQKTLGKSKYGQRVWNEVTGRTGYRAAWVEQTDGAIQRASERRADPKGYERLQADTAQSITGERFKYTAAANGLEQLLFDRVPTADREAFDRSFETFYDFGRRGMQFEQVQDVTAAERQFTQYMKKEAFDAGVRAASSVSADALQPSPLAGKARSGGDLSVSAKSAGMTSSTAREARQARSGAAVEAADAQIEQAAAAYKDEDTARIFTEGYREGVAVKSYDKAFSTFFAAGITGQTFAQVQTRAKGMMKFIGEETAKQAFEAGKRVAGGAGTTTQAGLRVAGGDLSGRSPEKQRPSREARQARSAEGAYYNRSAQSELDTVFHALAARTGLTIERHESVFARVEQDGVVTQQEANGQFLAESFKLIVSANANSAFGTVIHELGHGVAAYNAEGYRGLLAAIRDWYMETEGIASYEDAIEGILNRYEGTKAQFSRADAEEEFFSEAMAGLFSTEDGAKQFLSWLNDESKVETNEKKSIIRKMADLLQELFDHIMALIRGGKLSKTAEDFAQMEADRAQMLRQDFLAALDVMRANAEKGTTAENGAKYSIDQNFKKVFDEWDKTSTGFAFRVGTTSEVLRSLGVDERNIFWDASKIKKIMQKHPAMTGDVIKQVPNILEHPILVMRSLTNNSRLTLFGEVYDANNSPVLAVLELNPTGKTGNALNILKVASAYGKDTNPQRLIDRSEILYVDPNKKRTRNWLTVNRLQLPLPSSSYGFSNTIKPQSTGNVKQNNAQTSGNNAQTATSTQGSHSLGIEAVSEAEKSLAARNTELEQVTRDLEHQLKDLKRQLGAGGVQHVVDVRRVNLAARTIKKQYASKIDAAALTNRLFDLYQRIANDRGMTWDEVSAEAADIAQAVLQESKHMTEISQENRDVIRDIRSVGVTLNEGQKAAAREKFGSYGAFFRASAGSLQIRKDGTEGAVPLDQRYSELAAQYPWVLPADAADADQAVLLFEAVQALRNPYFDNESGFDLDSARDVLTAEIYETFFEVPETQTLENRYRAKIAKYAEQQQEKLDRIRKESRQNLIEARKDARSEAQAYYRQRLDTARDTMARQAARNYIATRVKRLDGLIRRPTNSKNVPEGFRAAVIDLVDLFTDQTNVFDKWRIDEIRKAYHTLQAQSDADATSLSGSYDFEIEDDLERLKDVLDGKRLVNLSLSELGTIKNVLDHFNAVIKNETEIFLDGRKARFDEIGAQALQEIQNDEQRKTSKLKAARIAHKTFAVDNLTPTYAFKDVGGTIERMWQGIRRGMDTYVRDIQPAKDFLDETREQYHVRDWKKDKLTIRTAWGEELTFTPEQAMLIWATAKRERLSGQESAHLMSGGVVYEDQLTKKGETDKRAHPLAYEDLLKIAEFLTQEQKDYVDEMVRYLSTDMADLGNEVSLELYGVKKFREPYYIPFNSDKNFNYKKFGDGADIRLKNMSMTKATVHGAKTPLVLSDFTNVWAKHVERMSAYHALVIPLENFTRVWNYKTATTEDAPGISVAAAFESTYGTDFKQYVETLMQDINGSVVSDSREGAINSMIRMFKKNAVFASASVVVQQPSAILRAAAMVDMKYLMKPMNPAAINKTYDECMQHAPVAVIKEIGGFDMTSGKTVTDWMTNQKPKGFKEKFVKIINPKDSSYRDALLSAGPGWADRATWAQIWNAVKAETKAKHSDLKGEALLRKAGERFSEVIDRTQVYDSVFSRSGNMRSKGAAMNMATAFMAEPTLSFNLLVDAAKQARRGGTAGKKYAARALAAFVGSVLLNAALKSIITAGRDKDKEKNYTEKYIGQLVSNFTQDLNPLSLMPFVRDVLSLAQGYDVSRADMDGFDALLNSAKKFIADAGSDNLAETWQAHVEDFLGSVGLFLGVPAKNIMRDYRTIENVILGAKETGLRPNKKVVSYAVQEEAFPILQALKLYKPQTKKELLFNAWTDGDDALYDRVAATFKDGTEVKNALIGQVKAGFLDKSIDVFTAEEMLVQLGESVNGAHKKMRGWLAAQDAQEETPAPEEDKDAAYLHLSDLRNMEAGDGDKMSWEYLDAALESGDMTQVRAEVQDLKQYGRDDDEIGGHIKTWIKDNDQQLLQAGRLYADGDVSVMTSDAVAIAHKYDMDVGLVMQAIRSAAGYKNYPIEGTNYTFNDLNLAIDSGDANLMYQIKTEIANAKMTAIDGTEQEKKNKAYQSMRQSLAGYWKPRYQAANEQERRRIYQNLKASYCYYGDLLDEAVARWAKGQE